MLELLKKLLNEAGADGWEIRETKTSGWEFYFIRHDLDQNRVKDVIHYNVTVYRRDGDQLGSASAQIAPTETEENLRRTIGDLMYQASLVKTPYYELNTPKEGTPLLSDTDIRNAAKDYITVLKEIPETNEAYLNSYEIFVNEVTSRLVTSTGIDVTEKYPSSMAEVVVNAKNDEHEIELYRMYRSGMCDSEGMKKELEKTMRYGRDRLVTVPTPALNRADVVFSSSAALSIWRYFLDNLDTAYVYRRMSDWKIGEEISPDVTGDKVTLKAVRELKNSSANRSFDREGAPVQDKVLMDRNVPVTYHGGRRFSQYLGVQDSFIVTNYEVSGGTQSAEAIRSGRYLEIVDFSDFQVDAFTGEIAGEIRLAYLCGGDTVTPVTGGSVSGSMKEFVKTMRMSESRTTYNNALVPELVRLHDVHITGRE